MFRKGQAAMEFLMTYGWAILVVLIAIGALAYFGVLNPSRFLPSSCTIAPGLSCDAFKVNTNGDINLNIRNGMGKTLTLVTIDITNTETTTACSGPIANNQSLADGAQTAYTLTGCDVTAVAGTRFKGDIAFGYTADGLSHSVTGSIVSQEE